MLHFRSLQLYHTLKPYQLKYVQPIDCNLFNLADMVSEYSYKYTPESLHLFSGSETVV